MYYVELEYPLEEVLYETDYMACLKMQSDANNFGSTTANVYDVKNNWLIASYDESLQMNQNALIYSHFCDIVK